MESTIYFGFDNLITKTNSYKILKKKSNNDFFTWSYLLDQMKKDDFINIFFDNDFNYIFLLELFFEKISKISPETKIIIISKNYKWVIRKILTRIGLYKYIYRVVGRGILLNYNINLTKAKIDYLNKKYNNKTIVVSSNLFMNIINKIVNKNIKFITCNNGITKQKMRKYIMY